MHRLGEVETVCDRVAIINQGELKVEGRVADLVAKHQSNLEKIFAVLRALGQVVSLADGSPVSGARLEVGAHEGLSAQDGRFQLDMDEGRVAARVTAEGYCADVVELEGSVAPVPVRIALQPAARVRRLRAGP